MINLLRYPSIDNLFAAEIDEKGRPLSRGPKHGFQRAEFDLISKWDVTEKVDGTNIRVRFLSGLADEGPEPAQTWKIDIAGRNDNANIHKDLLASIEQWATVETLWEAFKNQDDETGEWSSPEVVLFGEGYGPGIQKAGVDYGGDKRFILFDVAVASPTAPNGVWWLNRENIEDVARKVGVPVVPLLAQGVTLDEAMALVSASELLPAGSPHIEGVVLRTDPYLFDSRGKRVIAKYKVRDT